jgi:hypothetical protein
MSDPAPVLATAENVVAAETRLIPFLLAVLGGSALVSPAVADVLL